MECANAARSGGVAPAMETYAVALRIPAKPPMAAAAIPPVRCDRSASRRVADQSVEVLLVQGIEAARGLVQDQEVRLGREGEQERELLLVPVRVLAVLAPEVQVEALRDGLDVSVRDATAQAGDVRHD